MARGAQGGGGTHQSIERALSVLRAFVEDSVLRVSDVARLTELTTSTASRLLGTLVSAGMAARLPDGSYQIGEWVLTLAGAALNASSLVREARPVAFEIAGSTGLGANLAALRAKQIFYLLHFDGALAPRAYTLLGQRGPLHATALGKALLSRLDPDARRRVLPPEPFPVYTPHTIRSHDELDAALERVVKQGYAVEQEEHALGRGCIAAPICGRGGSPLAAISISGALSVIRLAEREHELAQVVIEGADRISSALGAVPTAHEGGPHPPRPAPQSSDGITNSASTAATRSQDPASQDGSVHPGRPS